ncbi:MAG: hypothetical protein LBH51_09370 [Treponema sp.]|jgi:hypothetical protein|nr:hypothetical protein [Treponema sp.]
MSSGEHTSTFTPDMPPDADSFESLLDQVCSRLWDRKLRYSLRRIRELAEILDGADRELEGILLHGQTGTFAPFPLTESPAVEASLGKNSPAAPGRNGTASV